MSSIDPNKFGITKSLIDAVNEALKGKQIKLDKNHNGKIDGQDFKMLRKEEVVDEERMSKGRRDALARKTSFTADPPRRLEKPEPKETKSDKMKAYRADRDKHMEEEVPPGSVEKQNYDHKMMKEGNPANKEKKNAAAAAVGAKNKDSQYLTRINPSVADKIRGREKMSGNDRKQFEEVEQVDEISSTLLHKAKQVAQKKAGWLMPGDGGKGDKAWNRVRKFRDAGVAKEKKEKAVKEENIDEAGRVLPDLTQKQPEKNHSKDYLSRIPKKKESDLWKAYVKTGAKWAKPDHVKEAYDDNSSNVSDWSDKKLKWHKEKLSSSSAKAHSELVRRSKTGQAAPKKTNEETKAISKLTKEATDPRDSRPETWRPNNTGYAWDKLSTRMASDPKDSKARKAGKQSGLKHSIKSALGSHGPKGKLPEETDPGFAEAAENPMAKQIAAKKDAVKTDIQKKIAAKQTSVLQAKANKRLSNIHASNDKCSCSEGKGKSMTCEVHGDTKKMKGGKEPIEINPPLREAQVNEISAMKAIKTAVKRQAGAYNASIERGDELNDKEQHKVNRSQELIKKKYGEKGDKIVHKAVGKRIGYED